MTLLLALGVPLAAALLLLLGGRPGAVAAAVAPWAALPALLVALLDVPGREVALSWVLLGMHLALDTTAAVFLLFTALLWLAAGVFARAYVHAEGRRRFFVFFLLALHGNLGATVARDAPSFYLFFALMTFAAYGLVVHDGTPAARRAGRVYVAMAVVGEVLLLSGLFLAVRHADSLALPVIAAGVAAAPARGTVLALLGAGLGVKAGVLGLHMWLPLAHPVAPTPASAVLSGCMIKVGLLGWLRLLPLGAASLADWGAAAVALGLAAAFAGVALGLMQADPKTMLAYSSVSQMGLMTAALGLGLLEAAAWPVALGAILLYAVHHGLAKGALFLGVAVTDASAGRPRPAALAVGGLVFAALALAGAPLTSGAIAKGALKPVTALAAADWHAALDALLALAAVGTTLLMARFVIVMVRRARAGAGHGEGATSQHGAGPSHHGPGAPSYRGPGEPSHRGPGAPSHREPGAPSYGAGHECGRHRGLGAGSSGRAGGEADHASVVAGAGLWAPWIALLVAVGLVAWVLPWRVPLDVADPTVLSLGAVWVALWPLLLGLVLLGGATYIGRRRRLPAIEPGDLLVLVEAAWRALRRRAPRAIDLARRARPRRDWSPSITAQAAGRALARVEQGMARLGVAALLLLVLLVVLLGVLAWGR